MNAKFEKWCEDYALDVEPLTIKDRRMDCAAAWQAAIQSLEVTPEVLLSIRNAMAMASAYDMATDELVAKAVLSALKEQAK